VDDRLSTYKRELLLWNRSVNLIGPEVVEHLDDHVAEAVAAAELLKPEGDVLDFGSGGGLPAIPMAIVAPNARYHLIEVDRKKWSFLKHVARECKLNAVIYGDRLQAALGRFPSTLEFSLVTSRAVGNPEEWVPLLSGRMKQGGRVALFQGSPEVAPILGFTRGDVFRLPRGTSNYLVTLMFHVEQT
jgi:16S rRNA (guanine(527)-N(7))-methyltransferase RsmG